MIAFFVHDPCKDSDIIVLPDLDCRVLVDPDRMRGFIAPSPDFKGWTGEPCAGRAPEQFGTLVATRDDQGDVCVVHPGLWKERMTRHL